MTETTNLVFFLERERERKREKERKREREREREKEKEKEKHNSRFTYHGPIIHPMFVGQQTTSPRRMS
jgi:hypothetical protein